MSKKEYSPSRSAIKAAADRAEGLPADDTVEPTPNNPTAPLGRPTAYDPKFVEQAKKLSDLGATDVEMADFFEVATSTFYLWKNKYVAFSEAIKIGKSFADERVERSLFQKAVGYSFEAEEIFQYQGEVVRAKVRKHIPPEATSMIFWLKNRKPDKWRDIQSHEHGGIGDFANVDEAELSKQIREEAAALGIKMPALTGKTTH